MATPERDEMDDRVAERSDLLDRLDDGDSSALAELIEHATGARTGAVKVTRGRRAAAAGD